LAARGDDKVLILAKAYRRCTGKLQQIEKSIATRELRRKSTLREIGVVIRQRQRGWNELPLKSSTANLAKPPNEDVEQAMTSRLKLITNKRNSSQSTGPRTQTEKRAHWVRDLAFGLADSGRRC